MEQTEFEVLVDQLDEILAEGVEDEDDAIEVAVCAGLIARMGQDDSVLADAIAWRDGPGVELLESAFALLDLDTMVDTIDALTEGEADEEDVDDALSDFDDVVAAVTWAGKPELVRGAAAKVEKIIRTLPDAFVGAADMADMMLAFPAVAREPGLYGYWLAVAEARAWG